MDEADDFCSLLEVLVANLRVVWDNIQLVLGEVEDIRSRPQIQRPEFKIRDDKDVVFKAVTSDVPDLITINGTLAESPHTQKGASLNYLFRRGQPFKGEPSLSWHINLERAEIRLLSPGGTSISVGAFPEPIVIEVHDFATDEVRKVEWQWVDWLDQLPPISRGIGALYDDFADGNKGEKRYASFDDAVARHAQLDKALSG